MHEMVLGRTGCGQSSELARVEGGCVCVGLQLCLFVVALDPQLLSGMQNVQFDASCAIRNTV